MGNCGMYVAHSRDGGWYKIMFIFDLDSHSEIYRGDGL